MASATFCVIPAVDLLGDDAVRLEQGDFGRVAARARPLKLIRRFAEAGARLIHLVDLDGARSGRIRSDLVRSLVDAAAPAEVQASGGVRSPADAVRLLEAGAARVVVGTAALAGAAELESFVAALGERLVVAIDVRDRRVAARGLLDDAGIAGELVLREVREAWGLPVLAAGGISSEADVAAVAASGCEGAVVGRALLDGSLPLSAVG